MKMIVHDYEEDSVFDRVISKDIITDTDKNNKLYYCTRDGFRYYPEFDLEVKILNWVTYGDRKNGAFAHTEKICSTLELSCNQLLDNKYDIHKTVMSVIEKEFIEFNYRVNKSNGETKKHSKHIKILAVKMLDNNRHYQEITAEEYQKSVESESA